MKNRYQLREEYAQHGIDFVYNDRNHSIYLKIKGAPICVEGLEHSEPGVQLTGWYHLHGGIKDAQDVPTLAQRAKDLYREMYADNPHMLKYLEPEKNPYADLFIFDEELCVQDAKHECIDGYLWATDGLVDQVKAIVGAITGSQVADSLENINFYPVYNMAENKLNLTSSFWYYTEENGTVSETHGSVHLPLTDEGDKALRSAMEDYCQARYGMSCLAFVNEARSSLDLAPLKGPVPNKPSLADKICDAELRMGNLFSGKEPVLGDSGR